MMTLKDTLKGWTVLVVDDDLKSLDIAYRLLYYFGADVHTAMNGKEGLERAKHVKPQIIITDLSMPIMDGWELIDCLKKDPELCDIPVIALTAHAMTGDSEKAITAGCHNYLTKPLMPTTFITDLVNLASEASKPPGVIE
jgi:CheY-like chemotaxis protein